jgi:hypothetical protein
MVDLGLVVKEKHTIEWQTLMLWLLMRQACGGKIVFTHQNAQQRPQTYYHFPRQTKRNINGGLRPGSRGETHH